KKISPIVYVSRSSPPFLFFHGAEDKLVPPRNSTDMAEKLRAAGVSAKAVVIKGEGHGSADWAEKGAKSTEQAAAFFGEHLKKCLLAGLGYGRRGIELSKLSEELRRRSPNVRYRRSFTGLRSSSKCIGRPSRSWIIVVSGSMPSTW